MRRFVIVSIILFILLSATIRLTLALAPVRLVASAASLTAMFTNPDGSQCAVPCLFGARPGAMTIQQAAVRVAMHPYVHDTLGLGDQYNLDDPSRFIARNGVNIGMIPIGDGSELGSIFYANVSPAFTLGQILATLGEPATVTIYEIADINTLNFNVYLTYPDKYIEVLLLKDADTPLQISDHPIGIFVTTRDQAANIGSLTACDPMYCRRWGGLRSVSGYGIALPPTAPNVIDSTIP